MLNIDKTINYNIMISHSQRFRTQNFNSKVSNNNRNFDGHVYACEQCGIFSPNLGEFHRGRFACNVRLLDTICFTFFDVPQQIEVYGYSSLVPVDFNSLQNYTDNSYMYAERGQQQVLYPRGRPSTPTYKGCRHCSPIVVSAYTQYGSNSPRLLSF